MQDISLWSADVLAAALEFRGGENTSHLSRMRQIIYALLTHLSQTSMPELTQEKIGKMAAASVLHDIGKLTLPQGILCKPGRLTALEYRQMSTHTIKGWELLQKTQTDVPDFEYFSYACDICRSHHERWDGNGYPDRLQGEDTPIWAQAAALADVYDALVGERVYKPAYPHEKAMEMILNGSCGVFNPLLIDALIATGEQLCGITTKASD